MLLLEPLRPFEDDARVRPPDERLLPLDELRPRADEEPLLPFDELPRADVDRLRPFDELLPLRRDELPLRPDELPPDELPLRPDELPPDELRLRPDELPLPLDELRLRLDELRPLPPLERAADERRAELRPEEADRLPPPVERFFTSPSSISPRHSPLASSSMRT